jgi:hypothetical protein
MRLDMIGVTEIFNDPDEIILAKLLSAHQAIRDVKNEMKLDVDIRKAQKELDEVKAPYKKRILRQQSIINAAELVARSRGIILPEDKID